MERKILFAVEWIEVEYGWGDRPEGYLVFDNLNKCIEDTKESSKTGNYEGGYMGPVRPLGYYETTDLIEGPFPKFVKEIKFKSKFNRIN